MLKLFLKACLARQGNAMVLAVLILLALTSVGVVSIQHTNTDLIIAGNLMRVAKNEMITEAATAFANANIKVGLQEEIITPYDRQRRGPVSSGDLDDENLDLSELRSTHRYSTADPDPYSNADGTLDLPVVVPPPTEDPTAVLVDQGIVFDIWYYPVNKSSTAIPGNDTGAEICYLIVDVDSFGTTPDGLQTVDQSMAGQAISVHGRSRVVAGPFNCK